MSQCDARLSVHVDVTNPGQFFACCGLLEVAHRLWHRGGVEGWVADGQFWLARNDGKPPSMDELVNVLIKCDAQRVPIDDEKTDPIQLGNPIGIRLDWWRSSGGKPNLFKTWAANATSLQMFTKWKQPLARVSDAIKHRPEEMLSVTDRVQGSYGFDSDLGWDKLTVGFSLNEHDNLKRLPTRPAVELFGAIGLQRFFPNFDERAQLVRYSTWHVPLAAPVARVAALGLVPCVRLHSLQTRFVYRGSFKGLDTATIVQGEIDE